jgi:hypothetical protein
VSAPATVVVKPGVGRDTLFQVTMTINGALLRGNFMNSGSQGANPAALTSTNTMVTWFWMMGAPDPSGLACPAAQGCAVVPDTTDVVPGSFPQVIGLNNTGVGTAQNDAYALLAVSPNQPEGGFGKQMPPPRHPRRGHQHLPGAGWFLLCEPILPVGICRQHLGAPGASYAGHPSDLAGYEPGRG